MSGVGSDFFDFVAGFKDKAGAAIAGKFAVVPPAMGNAADFHGR